MTQTEIFAVLSAMADRMEEEKEFLTDLDNAIADGDHGINMARGFRAAADKLPDLQDKDLGTVFRTFGMTLVSTVGGSAGPLYGTAFLRAGAAAAGKRELDADGFTECLKAAIDGVMARGKAVKGEKTMLDAMIPAYEAMSDAKKSAKERFLCGVKAAEAGVEYTKTIAATKGRASYIGERSIGHQDPGATSFTYLLQTVEKAVK